jgi:hypothetical protein
MLVGPIGGNGRRPGRNLWSLFIYEQRHCLLYNSHSRHALDPYKQRTKRRNRLTGVDESFRIIEGQERDLGLWNPSQVVIRRTTARLTLAHSKSRTPRDKVVPAPLEEPMSTAVAPAPCFSPDRQYEFVRSSFVGKSGALFWSVRIQRGHENEPRTKEKTEGTGTR